MKAQARSIRLTLAAVALALVSPFVGASAANASDISCDLHAHTCSQAYVLDDGTTLRILYGYDNHGDWWIITLIHG